MMTFYVIGDRAQWDIQQEAFLSTISLRYHNPQLIWDQNTCFYLRLNLQPVITRNTLRWFV